MMPESLSQLGSSLLTSAGESAVRSIALALTVAILVRILRVNQPRLRLLSWTGVLYAAMLMPLLGLFLPSINLPLLPGRQQVAPQTAIVQATGSTGYELIEPLRSESAATVNNLTSVPATPLQDGVTLKEYRDLPVPPAGLGSLVTGIHIWLWTLLASVFTHALSLA